MTDHLFVVTGGPGSGKSSLVAALAATGLRTVPEAGRAIIKAEVAAGGTALPWADRAAFAQRMLEHDVRSHRAARMLRSPTVCDRGVPDVSGYLTLCRLPIAAHVARAAEQCRYNRTVFVAPHWPAIYARDSERRQSESEAAETCEIMRQTYAALAYDLVVLPLASVAERVAFVRARIAAQAPRKR